MATFRYKAHDRHGHIVSGVLEGDDKKVVAKSLVDFGYRVLWIDIEPIKAALINKALGFFKKIRRQDAVFFTRQLATMLVSGISLLEALDGIEKQIKNQALKDVIGSIHSDISGGTSLSDAVKKHPAVFSEVYISMIRSGEESGKLGDVLEDLSELEIKEIELSSQLRSAMVYPAILTVVAISVITFLLIGVLPKFISIFEAQGAKLPLPTLILMSISAILRRLWFIIVLAAVGLGVWFKNYISDDNGRYDVDRALLKLPVFGPLFLKVIIARFSRTLGILTRSGVPILNALEISGKVSGNMVFDSAVKDIRSSITGGHSIVDPFKVSGLFPPMVIQMISAGEKSGKLDNMLEDIANFYDTEVTYAVRNMVTILEPLLLLVMGVIVGFIALSVLLPIFNLVKVFR